MLILDYVERLKTVPAFMLQIMQIWSFQFRFLYDCVRSKSRLSRSELMIVSTATKQLRVWDSTNHWTGCKSLTGIPNNMSLLANCLPVVVRGGYCLWSEPSLLRKQSVNRATSRTLGLFKQCLGSFHVPQFCEHCRVAWKVIYCLCPRRVESLTICRSN